MSFRCDFLKAGVKRSLPKVFGKEENKKVDSEAQEFFSYQHYKLKETLELCYILL